jgi:hypothetical protein
VSNFPQWKLQLGCGLVLCICVFAAAGLSLKGRRSPPRSAWLAVAISATVGGILLGVCAENMFYPSFGLGGWLERGVLLAATTAALLLSAGALMSGQPLPTFVELIGPRHGRTRSLPTTMLGFTLIVIILIATETALSLVFDARWRDFPFASLTMAVVPIWILASLNRPKSGPRPIAEAVFTGLFAMAAIYIACNEGADNWQALWTAAAYLLLGATLWRARAAPVAEMADDLAADPSEQGDFGVMPSAVDYDDADSRKDLDSVGV